MIFRSLTLGLLGACVVLLVTLPRARGAHHPPAYPVDRGARAGTLDRGEPGDRVSVIDVAPRVAPSIVASLVALAPGEHVTSVDDAAVGNDLEAGALISGHARGQRYIDVSIAGAATPDRRVLLLLH